MIEYLRDTSNPTPYRPSLENFDLADVPPAVITLMKECWHEDPSARPEFKTVLASLKAIMSGKNQNLTDHVLELMESYAEKLEQTVNERTQQLVEEKKKADLLLYRMLPK